MDDTAEQAAGILRGKKERRKVFRAVLQTMWSGAHRYIFQGLGPLAIEA